MITLTINDREVSVYGTATILEAAASVGIKIPTLCYFKGLDSFGGCRMCLVEIERVPRLQTACTVRVTEGMVVRTESEAITAARRAMLEFLLINHPLDCPVCDKAGECDLQDLVAIYGAHEGRFLEGKRTHPENFNDPFIVRNMDRCILCTRCTRMCDGPQGAYAIAVTGRGSHSFIEPFSGGRYNCEYCGNCLTVCPVGAIMSRLHRHSYRPWYVEREVETVCGFCGVGCTMVLQMRGGSIIRTMPYVGEGAVTGSYGSAGSAAPAQGLNKGLLCVRGRFGYDYLENNERLETPLIRKKGILEPVTWDEALSYVASGLKDVKAVHGAKSIGAIASGRCTNEDNYMLQKLMRFVIGTNNIDSSARFYYSPAQSYLERIFGHGVTANLIPGIANADGVLVAGGDPTAINPILGLQVRALWRKRGKIIVVGTPSGLRRFVNYEIKPHPYLEEAVLGAIVTRLAAKKGFRGENDNIEKYIKATAMPGEQLLKKANVSKEIVDQAAEDLAMMKSAVVIIGPELMERPGASKNLFLVSAIAYLTDARIFLLSERPNYQGVIDMGCAPDILPGGRPIEADVLQHKIKDADVADHKIPEHKIKDTAWTKAPVRKGLNLFAMIEAALEGNLKALYVMGENPVFNFPDRRKIENALSKVDFLIVHDIFMTETARRADVVLPAAAWTEKDGTFTNLERRLQRVRSGIPTMPGRGSVSYHRGGGADKRPEWKTLAGIGRLMGMKENYLTSSDVWEEVSRVSTLHAGLSYDRIAGGNTIWPYGSEPFRGVEGEFEVEAPGMPPAMDDGKIYLLQERQLYHSGSITRKSKALMSISCEAHVLLNAGFAERCGLKDGDKVIVTTETGSLTLPVKTDREIPENVAYVPNNFDNVSPLGIIGYTVDGYLGSISLSGNVVTITKADGPSDAAAGEGYGDKKE
ncbi:MAG: molybdopterin-dependent oxidoreductase [Nitrospirae bacterium]|nr:molybdopterin-dependent oxidoreductase [Nitrospirota bacterium]